MIDKRNGKLKLGERRGRGVIGRAKEGGNGKARLIWDCLFDYEDCCCCLRRGGGGRKVGEEGSTEWVVEKYGAVIGKRMEGDCCEEVEEEEEEEVMGERIGGVRRKRGLKAVAFEKGMARFLVESKKGLKVLDEMEYKVDKGWVAVHQAKYSPAPVDDNGNPVHVNPNANEIDALLDGIEALFGLNGDDDDDDEGGDNEPNGFEGEEWAGGAFVGVAGIIGVVDVVGCEASKKHEGKWVWIVGESIKLKKMVMCGGFRGVWNIREHVAECVIRQIDL